MTTQPLSTPTTYRRRHPTASCADRFPAAKHIGARTTARTDESFAPAPHYSHNPAIEARTCPDCHAEPGEPCHWACSSWWS